MDQEKAKRDLDLLKRTAEDTTDILLEFIAEKEQGGSKKTRSRSRTKSVETAKALLSSRHAATQEVIVETESEGFVVLSKIKTTCRAGASLSSTASSTCGVNNTSTKRPATLSLQPATDPEDPPLFSPCQSYPPPCTAGRMPQHAASSPTLSSVRKVPNCSESTRSLSQMSATVCPESSQQLRARAIAERLQRIGDDIENRHDRERFEQNLAGIVFNPQQSVWRNVTRIFSRMYNILSLLNQQFGDSPPHQDESWQLFCKTLSVLMDELIPQISSLGGWSAILRDIDSPVVLGSTPRSHDHHSVGSPCLQRTIPASQSTPCTMSSHRRLLQKEYQPSPGSQRSQRIYRSQTTPSIEIHPQKLWRLSESGSLIDEDGNDDFCESLKREKEKRESDFESSGLSIDSVGHLVDQQSDDESEKDDLVFAMEETSLSSPVTVAFPHCQEVHTTEPLCDSGHVSSWETLSGSSTPPRDVSFTLGGTPSRNDSAVDVRQAENNGGKRRPKSGCTFENKDESLPFDRHRGRSRSMPISKRKQNSGSEKSRKRSPGVVPSPQFNEGLYGDRSISLSGISETVLYEAVRSLFT